MSLYKQAFVKFFELSNTVASNFKKAMMMIMIAFTILTYSIPCHPAIRIPSSVASMLLIPSFLHQFSD